MRLNKFLASTGSASRRRGDELIRAGRVQVNGDTVLEPWFDVDPESDIVMLDGVEVEPPGGQVYILLNKPRGIITTVTDPHGRPTVISIMGPEFGDRRLFPVGRLDVDTTGALLITDDGELAYRLTHPKFETEKVYVVRLAEAVGGGDLKRLQSGLKLEDGPIKPDEVNRRDAYTISVTLHEGRKRIVRRMFAELGYTVLELHRTSFSGISADELAPGEWRELTEEEVERLKRSPRE